jgi:hypothetical protein
MSLNKIVDGRLHDFHVYSDCELMKNIKVIIQHIHGIEHITDKLLQTKSLEFTYESLVIFEASLLTMVVDSSEMLQLLTFWVLTNNKRRKFRVLGQEKGILRAVLYLTARWRSAETFFFFFKFKHFVCDPFGVPYSTYNIGPKFF